MEIIKIFIFSGLFWYLTFSNFLTLICFYNFFFYIKNNKHLIINEPNPFNILMFLMISTYEILLINLKILLFSINTNKYFSFIINKINVVNNYYLEKKKEVMKYLLTNLFSKIYLYTMGKVGNLLKELDESNQSNDSNQCNKVNQSNDSNQCNKVNQSNETNQLKNNNANKIRNSKDAIRFLNNLKQN
jgi:hypothetical protein